MSGLFDQFKNPEGDTYNGVAAMSAVSGLSQATVLSIWEQVKANNVLLDGCRGHDFSIEPEGKDGARRRICRRCGGKLDLSSVVWYERGLAHAQPGNA